MIALFRRIFARRESADQIAQRIRAQIREENLTRLCDRDLLLNVTHRPSNALHEIVVLVDPTAVLP